MRQEYPPNTIATGLADYPLELCNLKAIKDEFFRVFSCLLVDFEDKPPGANRDANRYLEDFRSVVRHTIHLTCWEMDMEELYLSRLSGPNRMYFFSARFVSFVER